ncbi:MAG: hypothetical protein R3F61_11960 [Myxococcota bacterium]
MRVGVLCVVLSGCLIDQGRYQDRQREICHPEAGCADRPWWPDADGDGWGDGSRDPEISAVAPEGRVNNLLDCDDTDPDITADIAGLCPGAFGDTTSISGGSDAADFGSGSETAEWVVVELEPPLLLHEALDRCGDGWGGILGAPRGAAEVHDPVWVAADPESLHDSWADATLPTGDGALVWSDGALVLATPATRASVACLRPTPVPRDWETFVVPE